MKTLTLAIASWIALSFWTWSTIRFSWLVPLSTGITIGILYVAAIASETRGWTLFRLLVVLCAGIGVINIQLENVMFRIMPPRELARATVTGLAAAAAVSAAIAWGQTLDRPRPQSTVRSGLNGRLWLKLPLLGVVYLVLFLMAGSLAFPFVRGFYARSGVITMPSFGVVLLTEFVRGLIHVGALIPLLHTMRERRAQAAVLAGLALSILGGVASLLLPIDEILPPEVRRVHMIEILGSNFSFGVITAFLLVPRARPMLPAGAPVRS